MTIHSEPWESKKLRRLRARVRVLNALCRLMFVVFCSSIGFVVFATSVPQQREHQKLRAKLADTLKREHLVVNDANNRRIELQALREDPDYLEVQARDRLDFQREGERILRIKQDP